MLMYELLQARRSTVLELTKQRIRRETTKVPDETIIDSLPELLDDLIAELRSDQQLPRQTRPTPPHKSATQHGNERLAQGFSLSELVHDYGALCHSISELAQAEGSITAREYQILNQVLDAAIAASVEEYAHCRELQHDREKDRQANEHLGFIAHELRNTVAAAMLSFQALRKGQVSIGGRTADVSSEAWYDCGA